MKRRIVAVVASILALSFFASAALAAKIVRVGYPADGKTITLKRGDKLVVSLGANATTGYSWRVDTLNRARVRLLGNRYVPTKPIEVGSGGTAILTFLAVRRGRAPLELVYMQAGNPAAKPTKRFALTLVVR